MSSEVELRNAATDLLSLLRDYMVVTSLTANDRFEEAVERLRVALSASPSIGRVGDEIEQAARAGWEKGRRSWCPAKVLEDQERTERDWVMARPSILSTLVYHEEPAKRLTIDRELLRRQIERDPDEGEIGAGFELADAEGMERLAMAALPVWARDELTKLRALVYPPDNGEAATRRASSTFNPPGTP